MVPKTVAVELDENELKMLLVAIRQVRHTFNIAEAQSRAAGEQLDTQYEPVQKLYGDLERKFVDLMDELSNEGPMLIK
jgi:hypothetical protein